MKLPELPASIKKIEDEALLRIKNLNSIFGSLPDRAVAQIPESFRPEKNTKDIFEFEKGDKFVCDDKRAYVAAVVATAQKPEPYIIALCLDDNMYYDIIPNRHWDTRWTLTPEK